MNNTFTPFARALIGLCQTVENNLLDILEPIIPVFLPVFGISIAVFFGVKFIKKIMR